MKNGSNVPFDPRDPAQLSKFRNAVAGAFRDLLGAWKRATPPASFETQYEIIWNKGLKSSNAAALTLLTSATHTFQRIADEFSGYQDSVPCVEEGDEPSVDARFQEVRDLVIECADPDRLEEAIRTMRLKHAIDWRNLVDWSKLSELRRLLDELPYVRRAKSTVKDSRISDLATVSPNFVEFRGKPRMRVPPQTWKLLDLLLRQSRHVVSVAALAKPVWGHHAEDVTGDRVKTALKRLRDVLAKLDAPFSVESKNDFVSLTRGTSTPTRKKKKSQTAPKRRRENPKGKRSRKK